MMLCSGNMIRTFRLGANLNATFVRPNRPRAKLQETTDIVYFDGGIYDT